MTLTEQLDRSIQAARAWLGTMTEGGGVRRNFDLEAAKPGPISTEITGYATHLYAWLFSVYRRGDDRIAAKECGEWLRFLFESSAGRLPYEPDQPDLLYFFDMGIVARGLYALSKAFGRAEFWDVAISIGTSMRYFQSDRPGVYDAVRTSEFAADPRSPQKWWSREPGPYQRKAAIIWKILKTHQVYDELDNAFHFVEPPATADTKEHTADLLHPYAYNCEALLMGEASQDRATRAFQFLQAKVQGRNDIMRCDVLAQYLRLHMLNGLSLPVGLYGSLLDMQHGSGGFHFRRKHSKLSPDLSVHATIFAIQAMAMAHAPDLASKLPGPLGRRELTII